MPTSAPEKDLAAKVAHHDRVLDAMYTHQDHLAQQIAELSINLSALRKDIPGILREAAIETVGSERFWKAARDAAARQARHGAGGLLFDWGGGLVKRLFGLLIFAAVLYEMGGMHALYAWAKAWWTAGG